RAPASASARASASPRPRVDPVTSAVRPERSNRLTSLSRCQTPATELQRPDGEAWPYPRMEPERTVLCGRVPVSDTIDRTATGSSPDDRQHDVRRVRRRVQDGLVRHLHARPGADVLARVEVAREAREARARHVEPDAVALLETVRHRVAADPVLRDLAWLEQ